MRSACRIAASRDAVGRVAAMQASTAPQEQWRSIAPAWAVSFPVFEIPEQAMTVTANQFPPNVASIQPTISSRIRRTPAMTSSSVPVSLEGSGNS